jgi:predicted nucleic acid-binding protein
LNARIVVDASVAVKWVIAEEHSALAEALMGRQMIAPALLLIECGNALLRRARMGDLPADTVAGKVAALRIAPVRLVSVEQHLEAAITLATHLRHSLYDCLYLALALVERVQLITADQRFVTRVRRDGRLAGSVTLLTETAH